MPFSVSLVVFGVRVGSVASGDSGSAVGSARCGEFERIERHHHADCRPGLYLSADHSLWVERDRQFLESARNVDADEFVGQHEPAPQELLARLQLDLDD